MVLRVCTSLDYLRGDREIKGYYENKEDKNDTNNIRRWKCNGIHL